MNNDLVCMTVVGSRKKKIALLDALTERGAKLINVEFGLGSARVSSYIEVFGFDPEDKKVILICLMRRENAEKMFDVLYKEFHFDEPNTGIAFTLPLDKLVF